MKKQTYGVGLVGFGAAGRHFHAPLIQATPGLELLAVASSRPDAVHEALPEVDVVAKAAALFARADIDLVVIATPNETHFPLGKAALNAGKHLVIDKPFTVSVPEARLLKTQAEKAERLLSVFHNRRWDSDCLTLQGLLEARTLGRPVSLELRFDRFRPRVTDRWRDHQQPGSGIWYDLGAHLLDQVHTLFGMPKAILLELAAVREGAKIDDDFLALLEYENLRITLQASSLVAETTPRMALHGTRGSFVKHGADPQERWLREGQAPTAAWGVDERPGELILDEGEEGSVALVRHPHPAVPGDYLAYYAGIVDALAGQGPPPVTADEALAVMTLLEAGLDSYRQARWIRLREEGGPRHLHAHAHAR
ncbi:oxidoreductase [Halomonas sp. NO4]|uniref:oxidoreductase n=1 Tax=Halomonas sp. NO4 TaxID=2484813 RepID=UPI0013D8D4F3|nr:oxidoreductase [Halomonas sp. NO4]